MNVRFFAIFCTTQTISGQKQDIIFHKVGEVNQTLKPVADFWQAANNTARSEFSGSINKVCFFHLCQNFERKFKSVEYGNNEDSYVYVIL